MARLERVYSSIFGAESTKGSLYGGFYTFLGGVFLGLGALVVLFLSMQQPEGTRVYYSWREGAIVLGLISTIAIFWGISITLPSKRGMRIAALLGVLLCMVATLLFSMHYPEQFNVGELSGQGDYTIMDVSLFTLGLVILVAGTFTSLVGYYAGRMGGTAAGAGGIDWSAPDAYDIPDSVIEKDIEFAMKRYKYSWGEGESQSTGVQINVQDQFEKGVVVGGGKGVARTVTLEAPQVDDATAALRNVRPNKDKQMSTEWADETTNALLAFRKQKAEAVAARARMSWWQKLLAFLGVRKYRAIGAASARPPKPGGR